MNRIALISVGSFLALLAAIPIFAQQNPDVPPKPAVPVPEPALVTLPIKKVILSNAGIGYFHREGTIDGPSRVEIKVSEEDVNDLILTLIARDANDYGHTISYDNKAPADITLKAFSIDLTQPMSISNLLAQVRGEQVEITDRDGSRISGAIVGVEVPRHEIKEVATTLDPQDPSSTSLKPALVPPAADAVSQVNLLSAEGVESLPITKIKRVKFARAELQAEFRKALEALAAARGAATKGVRVNFTAAGKRNVSVGYIMDSPIWKPTYRLIQAQGQTRLIGLAAIENTTDEDWDQVQVRLTSGRPMTFKMDLYDPLFVPRPMIEPQLYASLRPPLYQGPGQALPGGGFGGFGGQLGGQFGFQGGQFGGNLGIGGGGLLTGMRGGAFTTSNADNREAITRPSVRSLLYPRLDYDQFHQLRQNATPPINMPSVLNPAQGDNLGESFEYQVARPVNLGRFKSALVPILDIPVQTTAMSIYNPTVMPTHPLKGFRLINGGKEFIAQGPISVFHEDHVLGQARLSDTKPGESRLISYAIDLDVQMKSEDQPELRTFISCEVRNGILTETTRIRRTKRTTCLNKSQEAKLIWITQPIDSGWAIVSKTKPVETTANLYRFEVKLKPGETIHHDVVEEQDTRSDLRLAEMTTDALTAVMKKGSTPPAVKVALGQVLANAEARRAAENKIKQFQAEVKEIEEEQTRLRANLEKFPKESELFKRYLKKFDDQETEIEKRRDSIKTTTKSLTQLRTELTILLDTISAK